MKVANAIMNLIETYIISCDLLCMTSAMLVLLSANKIFIFDGTTYPQNMTQQINYITKYLSQTTVYTKTSKIEKIQRLCT